MRAAQDNLSAGYGIFYPGINGAGGGSRQQYSPLKAGQNLPPSIFNLFTLSATVSYTLDIFGGERRQVEALGTQADLADDTALATSISLSSNVVNAMIAHAGYKAEIDTTEELIGIEKEQARVAQVQADAGTAPYAGVLSLQSQLATLEATVPQLEQQLTQTDNLLAALSEKHLPNGRRQRLRLAIFRCLANYQ